MRKSILFVKQYKLNLVSVTMKMHWMAALANVIVQLADRVPDTVALYFGAHRILYNDF